MNLARRLAPMLSIKKIEVQNWIFTTVNAWTILDNGKTARLNSGQIENWQELKSTSNKRSASTGKYYYEVLVSKYNVGDAQAIRIGIIDSNDFVTFASHGMIIRKANALIQYMGATAGNPSVHRWGVGDVIGCSIEPASGGNTNVRFYINGVDAGYNKNPFLIKGVGPSEIYARGYRNNNTRDIELKNQDLKYLPTGFEPW